MAAEQAFERARALRGLGRYDDALRLVGDGLAETPDSEDGLALLATLLYRAGRLDEAADALRRLLAVDPDSPRGLVLLATLHHDRDEDELAEPYARRAVAIDPYSVRGLMTLAAVLSTRSPGSAEAAALVDSALELSPEDPDIHLLRATLSADNGRWADAETVTLRALALDPTADNTILRLAVVRGVLGRFDESRDAAATVLRMDPAPQTVDAVLAVVETLGVPDALRELYAAMLSVRGRVDLTRPGAAGTDPALLAEQAAVASRMAASPDPVLRRRAADLAAVVLAADPTDRTARLVRAERFESDGEPELALPLVADLVAAGFGGIVARTLYVRCLLALERWDDAAAALDSALAAHPDSPELHRHESYRLRRLGRADEALAAARRAATLSPDGAGVQLTLGLAARDAGEPGLAEQALRAGVAQTGGAEVRAELALLLTGADRWDEAGPLIPPGTTDPDQARLAFHAWAALCGVTTERGAALLSAAEAAGWDPATVDEAADWFGYTFDLMEHLALITPTDEASATLRASLGEVVDEMTPRPADDSRLMAVLRRPGAPATAQ